MRRWMTPATCVALIFGQFWLPVLSYEARGQAAQAGLPAGVKPSAHDVGRKSYQAGTVARAQAEAKPLDARERAVHVLNRFSFGPMPGQVDQVAEEGADAWFDQQLEPNKIADDALEQRIATTYPALSLTAQQGVQQMPTIQMLNQVAQGKRPPSADPQVAALEQMLIAKLDYRKMSATDAEQAVLLNALATMDNQGIANQANGNAASGPDVESSNRKAAQDRASQVSTQLLALPKEQRMNALVQMPLLDRLVLTKFIADQQKAKLVGEFTPHEREIFQEMAGNPRDTANVLAQELMQAKILRATMSERQLQEVMTDFWFNHFNVFINKNEDKFYTASFERNSIRPLVLGKFSDLLLATAKDPAMLVYLDNWLSIGPDSIAAGKPKPGQKGAQRGLNENYGREVMELHSVGVNGGYTQADVTALAKILTGWTIDHPELGGGAMFDPHRHEPGSKHWFDHTVKENGEQEATDALLWLAAQPQTADFISHKLAIRFVSDDPPHALVDRMAKTFMSTGGDIREVLRTMERSPEFWQRANYQNKVKTPLEFVASSMRASGIPVTNPGALVGVVQKMGEPLYQMLPPTGYSMMAEAWMNSGALVDRLNFATSLVSNKVGGMKYDSTAMLAQGLLNRPAQKATGESVRPARLTVGSQTLPSGRDEAMKLMEMSLLGYEASARTQAAIEKELEDAALQQTEPRQLNGAAPTNPAQASATATLNTLSGLILGSPEFQMR